MEALKQIDTDSTLSKIVAAVKEAVGTDYLYLDSAINAKINTFSAPFSIWGMCASPEGQLYVMDATLQWHEVEDRPEDQRIIVKLAKYFHL